jgi:imidazolonepropionase
MAVQGAGSRQTVPGAGRPAADILVTGASEVITCQPTPGDPIGRVPSGVVAVAGERILAVGAAADISAGVDTSRAQEISAGGGVVAPGFVDAHTHLVFGGSRAREYAARLTHTREQVRAMGIPTGIMATVSMTRAEGPDTLAASAAERLDAMLRHGTTTAESKSGYGLTLDDELKLLQVNRRLDADHPIDLVSTFMGAHDFPAQVARERYVEVVVREMIPSVAERGLARFCDVFCDEGYYTVEESRRILRAGIEAGLEPKIHADQYAAVGGAELAGELGAVSADHLNFASADGLRLMSEAGVTAVLMPLIDFAVRHPKPSAAREWIEAGLPVALGTDLCPGGYSVSMQLAIQFACRWNGLSPEQALLAATAGSARACGLDDRGALEQGMLADIQIWGIPTLEDLVYRIGNNAVQRVIKRGKVVA